jgi:pimeloyl-ACP methyl ester carboxylesterase
MIHYEESGSGDPVVLLHGVAASLRDWDQLRSSLDRKGFHFYALDLLGHGESAKPEGLAAYHADAMVTALERFLDGVVINPPYTLVGHSLGGYLSLAYALRSPQKVRALILVDPVFRPDQLSPLLRWVHRRPEWGAWALRNTPSWLLDAVVGWRPIGATPLPRETRTQLALDYRRAAPEIVHIPSTFRDLSRRLHAIKQPTLVVWGGRDHTLAPHSFQDLVEALPRARGQPFPNCGHQPHLAAPGRFQQAVLEFLQNL